MEQTSSKNFILWIVLFLIVIIVGVGFSYALFSYARTSKEGYSITSGSVKLGYFEGTNGISLSNALPMSDDDVLNTTDPNSYFDFYISYAIEDAVLNYEIDIENVTSNLSDVIDGTYLPLDSKFVKVALLNKDTSSYVVAPKYFSEIEETDASNGKNGYYLYSSQITSKENTDNYRFFLWVSGIDSDGNEVSPFVGEENSSANKAFSVKLNVQAVANTK